MNRKSRILFFVPELKALDNGVLHSQVLSVANFLNKNGYTCKFMGAETNRKQANEANQMIVDGYGFDAFIYSGLLLKNGIIGLRKTSKRTMEDGKNAISEFSPTHIYSRSLASSDVALKIAKQYKAKFIYDVRGATTAEIAFRRNSKLNIQYFVAWILMDRAIRNADRLGCVSNKMNDWIKKTFKRKADIVIPCCYDNNNFFYDADYREILRKRFNFKEKNIVLCYCGGLTSKWQRAEDIFMLFSEITKISNTIKLLVLSNDTDCFNELVQKLNMDLNNVTQISVNQKDVNKYLSLADFGIIYRHDNIINNVASPIKIAEYLACGLPVVMTENIGDYSDTLKSICLGYVVNDKENISQIAKKVTRYLFQLDLDKIKKRCIDYANNELQLQSHLEDYNQLYRN